MAAFKMFANHQIKVILIFQKKKRSFYISNQQNMTKSQKYDNEAIMGGFK